MWSIPKFGNGNQQNIFVDLSSDEERRRMRCQDLSECNCRNVEKLYKRNSFRTNSNDKFSISLEN